MEQKINQTNNEKITVGSSFVNFFTIVVRHRWFLFWLIFIITVLSTSYALLSPKWYKSTVTVFPSEQTDLLGGLSGLSSIVKGFSPSSGLSALTGNPQLDKYIAILKSSKIADKVIEKYNYREIYEFEQDDYYEKILEEFQNNLVVEVADEGNLMISFFDKDPIRAAEVANYMVELLNEINTDLNVRDAKANRKFIEKRYVQNVNDIQSLEQQMREFQEEYGVVAVPEQVEQTVKTMAEIYSLLAQKEIQLNVAERTYGEAHPISNKVRIEVEELNKKISSINLGKDRTQEDFNLLIPFKQAPELGEKYLKIYRNLEIQYKILEFIMPLYEQAKVEEVKSTPSVLILDVARPAERKAKPRGSLYALLSFVIASLIGIIIVLLIEWKNSLRTTNKMQYEYIAQTLKSDFEKITFRRKK